ncbi:CD9 antigen-like [Petromyzon marinus]|uniref:Tetraspanin n=1 Tax=Petromyzon marinus TaxID=7757 RepID=A0AAJ7UL35_PETMA|nr:CD9 antigen-like [Petromyzon marinus]
MGVQGCLKCVKYLLFAFNFIFWICGSAVLGVALWLRFDPNTKDIFSSPDSPSNFLVGVYVLIGAGALMMLIGFLGCCGAIQESQCMLGTFFFCLLVVFAAEVAAGIYSINNKDKIPQEFKEYYNSLYVQYLKDHSDSIKTALIAFHKGLNCCGAGKLSSAFSTLDPGLCPNAKNFLEAVVNPDMDCNSRIDDIFSQRVYIIAAVGIGVGVVMVFGMVFSMLLCCAIRQSRAYI